MATRAGASWRCAGPAGWPPTDGHLDTASYPALYFGTAGRRSRCTRRPSGSATTAPTSGRAARAAATRGLAGVRAAFDGERWGDAYELMFGNAGIGLAALRLGDAELAEAAVTPYLRTAEATAFGQTWEQRRGQPARRHHISHGTLGIAYALAAIGTAVGRTRPGRRRAGRGGRRGGPRRGRAGRLPGARTPTLQQVAFGLERYSYGWCHGPAGDAQVFRLLAQLADAVPGPGGEAGAVGDGWRALVDRCWHTVTTSGLPERLRPGFWDNSGRCCGTGGVLALACDRAVEDGDGLAFADLLVADLGRRATMDASGARWSNVEHRASPPELNLGRAGHGQRRPGQRAAAARADHGRARSVLRGPVARPTRGRRVTAGRPPHAMFERGMNR